MQLNNNNIEKAIKYVTHITLCLIIAIGLIFVLFQIKPFWVDEWFIVDSLKKKHITELWGQLNFDQQFPRFYLLLFKLVSSHFSYSYYSLRIIPFITSICTMLLSYSVMQKIFKAGYTRYLFVVTIVSSLTFFEYYVEVKQYIMDILLSVLAIWQLINLLDVHSAHSFSKGKFVALCASFMIAPFFSYTYPIAVAPVFIIISAKYFFLFKHNKERRDILLYKLLPLLLGLVSIVTFYLVDVRHLMNDKIMYDRWSFLLTDKQHLLSSIFTNIYALFSQTGSGFLFETLFGVLGIASYIAGIVSVVKAIKNDTKGQDAYIKMYCILVLTFAIVLFLAGKLPLGTPRLNAFTTASIVILIIYFLNDIADKIKSEKLQFILPLILFAGVVGNVFTSYINYFTSPIYKKQLAIYRSTQEAINYAAGKHIPILITPGITYPYQQATIDAGAPDPAVWVLQTFPAYSRSIGLQIFAVSDTVNTQGFFIAHSNIHEALVGDGEYYHLIQKR